MDFLKKILKHLKSKNTDSFRKTVIEEKKKKYLFRDEESQKYTSSRQGFFSKQKKHFAPFARILTQKKDEHRLLKNHKILWEIWAVLLILSGYIIFFSPYFHVSPSQVLIESGTPGIDLSIAYRSIEWVYGKTLFLVDEKDVANDLKKSLKNISDITIDTLYPNGIKLILRSFPIRSTVSIYWLQKEWWLSDNGVLIPRNLTGTGTFWNIEIISESLRNEIFLDYKQAIAENDMFLIKKILEIFWSEWSQLPIQKIRYFEKENELHIALQNNTIILLTLEDEWNKRDPIIRLASIKKQLTWLELYINKYQKDIEAWSMNYIDARVIKKIFICREQVTCKNNLMWVYGESYR